MKLSFKAKMLAVTVTAASVGVVASIIVANSRIDSLGEHDLVEKSRAILSRLEAARNFIASQGQLKSTIAEVVKAHPDGVLSKETKERVLKNVPVFASMVVGKEGAEKEHYQFRVFSYDARNKDNSPNAWEETILKRFQADRNLDEWVEQTPDGKFLLVARPVRLSESDGCLTCHGDPATSPWGNGKDILGIPMENWKDGHFHGAFAIISSLDPVKEATSSAVGRIILFGGGAGVLIMLFAIWTINRPVSTLSRVASELGQASNQVHTASEQVSKAGQEVSSGSTQAASALQETVASIEELGAMVKQNSDNASQAAVLAKQSHQIATEGEGQIKRLVGAMEEISTSSKKIEEIINVIDEISFQTNLLALNAAVEAARAGEHGKGFAVVADAVRTLAQRSTNAAKDITTLIKDSLSKVDSGNSLAQESGVALNKIVSSVVKVTDLNDEIAKASAEQSNGLQQITKAMNDLDSSTQQNAAASEEVAASSEEMSAQSTVLNQLVGSLNAVIDGGEVKEVSMSSPSSHGPRRQEAKVIHAAGAFRKQKSSLESVIPFDGETTTKKASGGLEGF